MIQEPELVTTIDRRVNKPLKNNRPTTDGQKYSDCKFKADVALQGFKKVELKRMPDDQQCTLFLGKQITPYDIQQGRFGTCYFLTAVSAVFLDERLRAKVLPEGDRAYDKTAGLFHCRFWWFAQWFDVYIDDKLPFQTGTFTPYGVTGKSSRELWPALMEKAYAKFNGSYQNIHGGYTTVAYETLTAGFGEVIELKEIKYTPQVFFQVFKKLLQFGYTITCSMKSNSNIFETGHSYWIHKAESIKTLQGAHADLICVRNPWASKNKVWNGAWNPKAKDWAQVNEKDKHKFVLVSWDVGASWMTVADWLKHAERIHLCSLSPNLLPFDNEQMLNAKYVYQYLSQWDRNCADASTTSRWLRFKNPMLFFKINGPTNILTQVVSQLPEKAFVRVDLFQVVKEWKKKSTPCYLIRMLPDDMKTFRGGSAQVRREYLSRKGTHLLVPCMLNLILSDFMLRLFTDKRLDRVKDTHFNNMHLYLMQEDEDKFCKIIVIHGQWGQVNGGGQISRTNFDQNPQVLVTAESDCIVKMDLSQKMGPGQVSIGYELFRIGDVDGDPPFYNRFFVANYEHREQSISYDGKKNYGPFFDNLAVVASAKYKLKRGRYIAILFNNDEGEEQEFCFTLSCSHAKIKAKGYQTK